MTTRTYKTTNVVLACLTVLVAVVFVAAAFFGTIRHQIDTENVKAQRRVEACQPIEDPFFRAECVKGSK